MDNGKRSALGTAIPSAPIVRIQTKFNTNQSKSEVYYSDKITKRTDPFYVATCKECGHAAWTVTYITECSKCKSKNMTCIPVKKE